MTTYKTMKAAALRNDNVKILEMRGDITLFIGVSFRVGVVYWFKKPIKRTEDRLDYWCKTSSILGTVTYDIDRGLWACRYMDNLIKYDNLSAK